MIRTMSTGPILIDTGARVLPEWIDYNGHMNVAYYQLAFDRAVDVLFDGFGLDAAYRAATGQSTFALEAHICYLREVKTGDPLRFTMQLLDFDAKRLHLFSSLQHATDHFTAATYEVLSLHVSLEKRKAAVFPDVIQQQLGKVLDAHRPLPRPEQAGRIIGIRRG